MNALRLGSIKDIALVISVILALAAPAWAQTSYSWATAVDGNWSDTSKWQPNTGRPGDNPQDDVTIGSLPNSFRLTLDVDATVRDFSLGFVGATFYLPASQLTATGNSTLAAGTLHLAGGSYLQDGGMLTYSGATIVGGPIQLANAKLRIASIGAAEFMMRGDCTLEPGPINALQTISVVATGQAASLSGVAINSGTLRLDSATAHDVTLSLPQSLSNSGIFSVLPGQGGARSIYGGFTNHISAVADFAAATQFTQPGALVRNSGAFTIAPNAAVELAAGSQTFQQSAGILNLQGPLRITNGTFDYAGGTIAGRPIELTDSRLNLTYGNTASFVLHGGCTLGNSIIPGQSQQVAVVADGADATLNGLGSNRGTLNLDSTTAHRVTLNLSNYAGNEGVLNVLPGAGGDRVINGNLTNSSPATVNLNTSVQFPQANAQIYNSGLFNLAAGATVDLNAGGQSFTQSYGVLNVQGLLRVTNGTFAYTGGTITGRPIELESSTLTTDAIGPAAFVLHGNCALGGKRYTSPGQQLAVVADGADATFSGLTTNAGMLTLDSTGPGNVTLNLSGEAVNTGTLNVEPGVGGTRTIAGRLANGTLGVVNLNADTVFSTPGVKLENNGYFNVAPGAALNLDAGNQYFAQYWGTLNVQGRLALARGAFNLSGGSVFGAPIELTASQLTLNTSTVPAAFVLHEACTLTGAVSAVQNLSVVAAGQSAALNGMSGAISNFGTLRLDSTSADDVTVGEVMNQGQFTVLAGAGGGRSVYGNFQNFNNSAAVATFNADTAFTKPSTTVSNSALFAIAPEATVTLNAGAQRFAQSSGTLDIQGHLQVTGGTFEYLGGRIVGNPVELRDSALNLTNSSAASFTLRGACTMTGPRATFANQQVALVANGGPTTLTNLGNNSGVLTLDSTTSHDVTLSASSLSNPGVINVQPGAGGQRLIAGSLNNVISASLINFNTDTRFSQAGATISNNGTMNIVPSALVELNAGNQAFIQNSGRLNVQGRLRITNGTFDLRDGAITGNPIELISSTLRANGASPARFIAHGAGSLSGWLRPGQELAVVADGADASLAGMATSSGTINLDSTSAHDVILTSINNTGTLNVLAGAGGRRRILLDVQNSSILNLSTTLEMCIDRGSATNTGQWNLLTGDAVTVLAQGFFVNRGTIAGIGTLDVMAGSLINEGAMDPGFSAGTLHVLGDYRQGAAGRTLIQLGGTAAAQYDHLDILGNAYLNGNLEVSLMDGFMPNLDDSFHILSFADTHGTMFNSLLLPPLNSGLAWDTSTLYQDGTIRVATPEPATISLAVLTVALGMGARWRRVRTWRQPANTAA